MAVNLTLSPATMRMLVQKARAASASHLGGYEDGRDREIEFDADTLQDSHAHDGLAEEETDDLSAEELAELIADLNVDEAAELVATVWIGRGDYEPDDFDQAVEDARDRAFRSTAKYLIGMPLFADHLEAGLDALDL
ncbi:DUF3775 domain-containing protein [Stappia sp. WLB 29]|uniref:DUF3775 domain-containing protein n=1 Tax=Stappia sp. WLB 29 TaxID=2925220 RepID=UPI0020BE0D2E|nr:DUF3775 domain-containing protein [Stappia sp. WLB 29]